MKDLSNLLLLTGIGFLTALPVSGATDELLAQVQFPVQGKLIAMASSTKEQPLETTKSGKALEKAKAAASGEKAEEKPVTEPAATEKPAAEATAAKTEEKTVTEPAATEKPAAEATAAKTEEKPAAAENSETSSDNGESRRSRFSRGGGMGGGMRGGQFLERFREQYPNEVAEIESLQESDPDAAREKIRDLMGKAGFSRGGMGGMRGGFPGGMMGPGGGMPGMGMGPMELTDEMREQLKEKYAEELAEYDKLKESDPQAAFAKLRELLMKAGLMPGHSEENKQETVMVRDRHRRAVKKVEQELQKLYPEEYAALEKQRKVDPDGARETFRKLVKEADIEFEEGPSTLQYEYVDPKTKNTNGNNNGRNGFPGGGFPGGGFPGGMMGPPPGMMGPPGGGR